MGHVGDLHSLADALGKGLAQSELPPEAHALARGLAGVEGLPRALTLAAFEEARAKRPKTQRIDGFLFLLGGAADELRCNRNGGSTAAKRELDAVLALVGDEASKGATDLGMLMALARALAGAGIEPPERLQQAMAAGVEGGAGALRGSSPADIAANPQAAFDRMTAEFGDDPFIIHREMAEMAAAFPPAHRANLINGLFMSSRLPLRHAGLGFILDKEDVCASAAIIGAAESAERFAPDSVMISRLERMRAWLPDSRRTAVDPLLSTLRSRAIGREASVAAAPTKCFASLEDGSGSQSIFALVKAGRKWTLASALLKRDEGVTEAWAAAGLSKRESDEMAERIAVEAGAVPVSQDFLQRRISTALAANAAAAPPPFALIEVCELLGFGNLAPDAPSTAALLDALLAGLPQAQTGGEAIAAAHKASMRWGDSVRLLDSWFEAGEAVEALLTPIRGRKKRQSAMLSDFLRERREVWADRLGWAAATLKESAGTDPTWRQMALVARDVAGDVPLKDIPFMAWVAEGSVEAFESGAF